MKRKILACFCACALIASFALVGCSGGGSSTDGSTSGGSAASAESGDKTTISYNGKDYEVTLVEPGKLTVGSDCDYPPFIQMNGSTPEGFEADMMAAACKELGLEMNYLSPQNFDTLITSVSSNSKMDCAVSSFTITDERKQEIDFTESYYDSNQAVVTLKSAPYASSADLTGKKIAVQSGTTGADWAAENIKDAEIVNYTAITEAMQALLAGQVDAAVFDLPTAQATVKSNFTDAQVIEEVPTGEQYGIVVSKDNKGLTDALDAALATLESNGTMDEIKTKWIG